MSRERSISNAQRMASLAVLVALCLLAAWLLAARRELNPAVEVALRAPAPGAGAVQAAQAEAPAAPGAAGATTPEAAPGAKASLASLLPDGLPGLRALAQAEAFTPVTLSDKIDGKAELYLAAGFAAMACRSYQAGSAGQTARIEVSLYRMKSQDAAFAVFSGQRRPGAAQSGLAKNAYLTENALFLASGADYLEVIADRAGAKAQLETLAKAVLAGLGPGLGTGAAAGGKAGVADIQPADLFPKAGLKADSLRLAVADAFGCQGLTNVYTAEYDATPTSAGGGATAFLSRRASAAEAQSLAKTYQKFLTDNGYALTDSKNAPAGVPAGAVVLVLEGSVEVLLVRGPFLAGAHDAPDLGAALKLATALDAALKARGLEQ